VLKIATGIGTLIIAIIALIIFIWAYLAMGIYILLGIALIFVGILAIAKKIPIPNQFGIIIFLLGFVLIIVSMIL